MNCRREGWVEKAGENDEPKKGIAQRKGGAAAVF